MSRSQDRSQTDARPEYPPCWPSDVLCEWRLTVAGGHTDGFVPTPTAEYYKDGEWHSLQMTYPHDFGFSVVLSSGQVMLGGGCDQPIGIGQTYLTETYDPETHTFNGYCSLQRKRAGVSALELDSGKVVVAGNWYFTDGIERFMISQALKPIIMASGSLLLLRMFL